jgi:hypothetical protein
MTKLKPCPAGHNGAKLVGQDYGDCHPTFEYKIMCTDPACFWETCTFATPEEATRAWNTRAEPLDTKADS